MNIAFMFYGILFGPGGKTSCERDFLHCWPNIRDNLIEPFKEKGHKTSLFFSSYLPEDSTKMDRFYNEVAPKSILFSELKGSDAFTSKGAALFGLKYSDADDIDFVIFSRCDIHWSKKMANENIDYSKFNFLFKERDYWHTNNFTCDNFYAFPYNMLDDVHNSIQETYTYPRGKPYVDTHALLDKLCTRIVMEDIHFISEIHENSDVNSFFTCCRDGLPEDGRGGFIHPEVKERFGYA